jgi:hypothetical protein
MQADHSTEELRNWLERVSGEGWFWYAKILSANDTLLTGGHQAGPYIPKSVIFELFPSIASSRELNPRTSFQVSIDSHNIEHSATAIWYNNRVTAFGTRNEARITNWGGRSSPLLDPESTGSLCILAFFRDAGTGDAELCRVWVCSSVQEEEIVTDVIGPVEPGGTYFSAPVDDRLVVPPPVDSPCWLTLDSIPPHWLLEFPPAAEIVERAAANLAASRHLPPDQRLLKRRVCEYEIFRSVEQEWVLPRVREGFRTVDLFVNFANSVTNRRKARSGASLELHVSKIFQEEDLPFSHGEISEERKRPDFLFPSAEAYRNSATPAERLRMLAVKTTCKDRWRQILNEADRVPAKHLLTLQEGVSEHQFDEMRRAGVRLIVPEPLHTAYPRTVRPELLSLEGFITEIRAQSM